MKRTYDSTVARMAGNIAAGLLHGQVSYTHEWVARQSVAIARAIVAEVERTELKQIEEK